MNKFFYSFLQDVAPAGQGKAGEEGGREGTEDGGGVGDGKEEVGGEEKPKERKVGARETCTYYTCRC